MCCYCSELQLEGSKATPEPVLLGATEQHQINTQQAATLDLSSK